MEKEIQEQFDRLAAAVAGGFAELREEIAELRAAVDKNLHETQYLDRKLDNRFDLLERMLFDNLAQDRARIGTVEGKVKTLTGV